MQTSLHIFHSYLVNMLSLYWCLYICTQPKIVLSKKTQKNYRLRSCVFLYINNLGASNPFDIASVSHK